MFVKCPTALEVAEGFRTISRHACGLGSGYPASAVFGAGVFEQFCRAQNQTTCPTVATFNGWECVPSTYSGPGGLPLWEYAFCSTGLPSYPAQIPVLSNYHSVDCNNNFTIATANAKGGCMLGQSISYNCPSGANNATLNLFGDLQCNASFALPPVQVIPNACFDSSAFMPVTVPLPSHSILTCGSGMGFRPTSSAVSLSVFSMAALCILAAFWALL